MSGFFNYFPSLMYANTAASNIIAKIKFDESVLKNLAVYYPYTIEDGERADQVAETYYEDASYDWVVYLSNGIIDPYHEWPKSQSSMEDFVTQKYGSVANAQVQISHFKNNYAYDETVLSLSMYSNLSSNQKKFWTPSLNSFDEVVSYRRKELDLFSETNVILSLSGTFGNIPINSVIKTSTSVRATVSFANSSNMIIKHVIGGEFSGGVVRYAVNNAIVDATITSVSTLSHPIPDNEFPYWTAVDCWVYENEKNENSKNITLLSAEYLDLIEKDMRVLLQK